MMAWKMLRNTAAATVLAALVAVPAIAEAGSQYVVVAAEPADDAYPPGLVLNVDDSIEIPNGTVVTLLGEDGSVNAIPGPASITVTEDAVERRGEETAGESESQSTISKLANLLSGGSANADSLGVARSFGARPKPRGLDDPWVVSIHGDGPGCYRNNEIRLGRKSADDAVSVAFAGDKGSDEEVLTWREDEADIVVPDTVPVENGELFVRAGGIRALIELKPLPVEINLQNPVDVLGWMMDSGCEGQALAFTRQLVHEAQ